MESRSLKYFAESCAGEQIHGSPDSMIRRISTDSRRTQAGDLFVALEGERFDGHNFLEQVASNGVSAVIVNRSKLAGGFDRCAVLAVESTRRALTQMAKRYRQDFSLPIISVGGSNGKTTTKDLLASVLSEKLPTLWSEASFNNDIGVPLTLLNLEQTHRVAVMEVGTNHPGELAPLVEMIRPDYGVLTSIGREHLEFFGDIEGVAEEEGWLAELLPAHGKLFVNGDSPEVEKIVQRTRASVVRVGISKGNDWRASQVRADEAGLNFQVDVSDGNYAGEYRLNLLGRHQVVNALLAIAVGKEFGLSSVQIQSGLDKCRASKMRLQLWKVKDVQVLDDTYNANADSMRAALETLHDFPCRGRRIAVLGDMAELGEHELAAHAEVGRHAAELGVGHLFAVGKMALVVARAAREAGLSAVREFIAVEAAASALRDFVQAGDVVLLKASRAARLERIGDVLRNVAT
ncbi:MAG: UDP-N-acetylmuramoyl-tripeptide--D-alanyl-D-alanine ligase [Pedosphaera sp.]|nr:UDP-N-acetylmuramoyl-tripeptide--D-alanyl-D-alanine ligase [Pedosphaera sp.]